MHNAPISTPTTPRPYRRETHPRTLTHIETVALTEVEAARYLGLSRSTLRHARMDGIGPNYARIARLIRYTRASLDGWLDSKTVAQRRA